MMFAVVYLTSKLAMVSGRGLQPSAFSLQPSAFSLQLFGSYTLIRNIFRWLALALLAYVGAAWLAAADWARCLGRRSDGP